MKTNELAIFGIQSNMLGVTVEGENCNILLASGNYLVIKCPTTKNANEIKNTLLYYPITEGRDNNAKEFEFVFELDYNNILY